MSASETELARARVAEVLGSKQPRETALDAVYPRHLKKFRLAEYLRDLEAVARVALEAGSREARS